MSEYWVSAPKHFCKSCKVWLSGHPRNVAAHEQSPGHIAKQERLLKDMEINQRRQAQEADQKAAEVAAIEAAAHAAMKKDLLDDPTASIDYALNRFNRFQLSRYMLPPQRSIEEEVNRPLEEQRIAKYIAEKTGQKLDVKSTVAEEDDFRKTLIYYENESKAPSHMRESAEFADKLQWKEIKDETTDLPIWIHTRFNIALWDPPGALRGAIPDDKQEKLVSDSDSESDSAPELPKRPRTVADEVAEMARKVPKVCQEAPKLGSWQTVPESESVFYRGTGKDQDESSSSESDKEGGILAGYESDEDLKSHPAYKRFSNKRTSEHAPQSRAQEKTSETVSECPTGPAPTRGPIKLTFGQKPAH